ncbi:MAG TPA: phage holin family protein [Segeticoccus sp.]|uniref:phage holin family protein n=1 Tax=Segeticoccus sp. TaxID=2706531 RepID=UPI002D810DD4|nr:phage holin family protein [Segeticoccus sp.]HET8600120.1 phage holin family protein [Segeticoccus sp.]
MTQTGPDEGSALFAAVREDVRALLRQELRLAQTELMQKGRNAGKGTAALGGAAVCGALATAGSVVFTLRVLDRYLPPKTAAFLLTAGYGAAAGALAAWGYAQIREAMPLYPEETVENVQANVHQAFPGDSPAP